MDTSEPKCVVNAGSDERLRINHAANDDAECAKPIELAASTQGQLFG